MDKELEKPFLKYTEKDVRVIENHKYENGAKMYTKITVGEGGIPTVLDFMILKILVRDIKEDDDNKIIKVNFLFEDLIKEIVHTKINSEVIYEFKTSIKRLNETVVTFKTIRREEGKKMILETERKMIYEYRLYDSLWHLMEKGEKLTIEEAKQYQYVKFNKDLIETMKKWGYI